MEEQYLIEEDVGDPVYDDDQVIEDVEDPIYDEDDLETTEFKENIGDPVYDNDGVEAPSTTMMTLTR